MLVYRLVLERRSMPDPLVPATAAVIITFSWGVSIALAMAIGYFAGYILFRFFLVKAYVNDFLEWIRFTRGKISMNGISKRVHRYYFFAEDAFALLSRFRPVDEAYGGKGYDISPQFKRYWGSFNNKTPIKDIAE